jgi:hypothetical protein
MELGIHAENLGIMIDPYDNLNWRLIDDPGNDFVERSQRRLITQLVLDKLGIVQNYQAVQEMHQVLENLKRYESNLRSKSNETNSTAA